MKRSFWLRAGILSLATGLFLPAIAAAAEPQGAASALEQARGALDRGDLDAARPALAIGAAEALFELALASSASPWALRTSRRCAATRAAPCS